MELRTERYGIRRKAELYKLLLLHRCGARVIQCTVAWIRWSEMGDSQRGREAENTEPEDTAELEAVTKRQPTKTQQTEKT
jgi:hypothetical protein